jgi:hypothetical protein
MVSWDFTKQENLMPADNDTPKTEYHLGLNADHARVIAAALDMYTRIGLGQLETILEHPGVFARLGGGTTARPDAEYLIGQLKARLFGFAPNANHGIRNPAVVDVARQAYDIRCVIRHRLAWDRAGNPPERDWSTMLGVDFDDPSHLGDLPLVTMEKTE